MKIGTVKKITLVLLTAALIIGLLTFATVQKDSESFAILFYVVLGLFLAALAVIWFFARCPQCGAHLFYQFFKLKKCPKCHKKLMDDAAYIDRSKEIMRRH